MSFAKTFPILLPQNHHITLLAVRETRSKLFHTKVKDTLNELRSKFWIVKARSLVQKIIYHCVLCHKLESRSYTLPPQADLPSYNVKESSPFSKIGLDMGVPLYHKLKDGTTEKCCVALFTCCVTRAVHLEITPDLSTEIFL